MFTYWPFISLVVMGVMVTILLLLKFSDKICRVRMTAGGGFVESKYQDDQVNIVLPLASKLPQIIKQVSIVSLQLKCNCH